MYAPFQVEVGPSLSIGMLTAAARQADRGRLNERYEIRRTESPESILADLSGRRGPAVLLCSNYLWSLEHNLDVARRAVALNPDTVVVHGGPSTPKYEEDLRRFFDDHPDVCHVAVRGEGEDTIVALLSALLTPGTDLDLSALAAVEGLSYRDPHTGDTVTTPDRERIADLDRLSSPYLTGEFDHLPAEAFPQHVTFETNRGCPYGCTFCDWGSMTLSRIRKFDLERVTAEMAWAAERGIDHWVLADANVGIMSRDVEVAETLAEPSGASRGPEQPRVQRGQEHDQAPDPDRRRPA